MVLLAAAVWWSCRHQAALLNVSRCIQSALSATLTSSTSSQHHASISHLSQLQGRPSEHTTHWRQLSDKHMPHCWTVVFSRGLYDSKRKPGSKPPPPSKAKPTRPVKQPTYLRNQQIRSRTVRLILPDGANQIMPIADALAVAKSHNLDLVEISPQADPPVAKILDYSKLLHQQQQQQQEQERKARLKAKLDTPKEMHFTARIGGTAFCLFLIFV